MIVNPGAVKARVDYHAYRQAGGVLLSDIRIHWYVLCDGTWICNDDVDKINDNTGHKGARFTVNNEDVPMNGQSIAYAFHIWADCNNTLVCGTFHDNNKTHARTRWARCRKNDDICRFYR
jgi:hypothetical protein